jgi:hypothetical protein
VLGWNREGFQNAGSARTTQPLLCPHWQRRLRVAPFTGFTRARKYQIVRGLATEWLPAQTKGLALAALGGGRWEHLGCAAVAGQAPTQRVRQRRRTARVATSARRARPARTPPLAAASRSCLACGTRPPASTAASPRTGGDAADVSAGIGSSCAASGRSRDQVRAVRPSIAGCESSCCASHGRTQAGATRGSPSSC